MRYHYNEINLLLQPSTLPPTWHAFEERIRAALGVVVYVGYYDDCPVPMDATMWVSRDTIRYTDSAGAKQAMKKAQSDGLFAVCINVIDNCEGAFKTKIEEIEGYLEKNNVEFSVGSNVDLAQVVAHDKLGGPFVNYMRFYQAGQHDDVEHLQQHLESAEALKRLAAKHYTEVMRRIDEATK